MNWIDAKTNPPTEDGRYLVIITNDYGHSYGSIKWYSKNLKTVDDLAFEGMNYPGWYDRGCDGWRHTLYDDNVRYWMPWPELPEELKGELR